MKKTPGTDGAWGLLCVAMLRNENEQVQQPWQIRQVSNGFHTLSSFDSVQQPWQIGQVSNLFVQIPRLNRDYLFQRTAKSARSSCFCDPPGRFFDRALGSPQASIPAPTAVWIHYSNVFGKQVNCLENSIPPCKIPRFARIIEVTKKKGNKKRIAIIAVVVAAIIAVVVAAFLLLSPHEPEASSIKDAATTTQHPPSSQPVSSPAVQPQWQQTLPMLSH